MKRFCLCVLVVLGVWLAAEAERPAPVLVGEEETARAEICVVGDFVIHDSLISAAARQAKQNGNGMDSDFSAMLAEVKDILAGADLTVANVDGVFLGNEKQAYSGYPAFNTPPALLKALKEAGVDMLTMANNHSLDYWYDGLKTSLTRVEEAGLISIGAARSQAEKDEARVLEIGGIQLGFLNYTDSLNMMDKRANLDPNALVYGVNLVSKADFAADVRALREAGAEFILCFIHWGTEYRLNTPSTRQVNLAQSLVKAGVDVIVGGHPHVPERVDWLEGVNQFGDAQRTFCVYSLGNFLSGQRTSGRDGGVVLRLSVEKDSQGQVTLADASYVSTWVWKKGNDYRVVPILATQAARPANMTNAEWKAMRDSGALQDKAMTSGNFTLRAAEK